MSVEISEGEVYSTPEASTSFVPSDSKLVAALTEQCGDCNAAIASHLFQRKRPCLSNSSTYQAPQKSVIDFVCAKMVKENQDSTPNLQGPLFKLVHLQPRLRLFEGALKLIRKDASARSCTLRLEECQLLACFGGTLSNYADTRDSVTLSAGSGHLIYAGPDAAARGGVGTMALSPDVFLFEITNMEQLEAAKLLPWAFGCCLVPPDSGDGRR